MHYLSFMYLVSFHRELVYNHGNISEHKYPPDIHFPNFHLSANSRGFLSISKELELNTGNLHLGLSQNLTAWLQVRSCA